MACPSVWIRRSVSKPNESITGMRPWTRYNGGASDGAVSEDMSAPSSEHIVEHWHGVLRADHRA